VDLYGLPPEEFTAARDAAAKDDKSLKALRRPTLSAWIVNTLVRQQPDLLDDLAGLGAELADAQREGRGENLRQLAEQRRKLVASTTQRAVDLVQRGIAPAARTEVEQTLEAVLADPASAEAVRTGQLVRALSFAGFGGVDLEGAVAPLRRPAAPRKAASADASASKRTQAAPDTSVAERKAHEAAGALDDAVQRAQNVMQALEKQEVELAAARKAEAAADAQTVAAQQAVQEAELAAKEVHRRRISAQKDRDALARRASHVTKAVASAQDLADAARVALDTLRRG
jgi:hypothetical protein